MRPTPGFLSGSPHLVRVEGARRERVTHGVRGLHVLANERHLRGASRLGRVKREDDDELKRTFGMSDDVVFYPHRLRLAARCLDVEGCALTLVKMLNFEDTLTLVTGAGDRGLYGYVVYVKDIQRRKTCRVL